MIYKANWPSRFYQANWDSVVSSCQRRYFLCMLTLRSQLRGLGQNTDDSVGLFKSTLPGSPVCSSPPISQVVAVNVATSFL